jgi:hypothetical protein
VLEAAAELSGLAVEGVGARPDEAVKGLAVALQVGGGSSAVI